MVARRLRAWAAPLATAAMTATLALADAAPAQAQRSLDEAVFGRPVGYKPRHEGPRGRYRPTSYIDQAPADTAPRPMNSKAPPMIQHESSGGYSEEYIEEGGEYIDEGFCDDCTPCRRMFWVRGEYLYWWTKGYDIPPMVTVSGAAGTGVLGSAGTNVAYGGDLIGNDGRSGAKITFGWELFTCTPAGVEISYFGLDQFEDSFRLDTPANATLARPFFNIRPDVGIARQDALIVSQPGARTGAVQIDSQTEFQGGGALVRWTAVESCAHHMDMVLGYRYLRLDDSILATTNIRQTVTAGGVAAGTTINLFDLFDSKNEFNGVEIGTMHSYRRGRVTLDTMMKLAIGGTSSTTTISGGTIITVPNVGAANSAGGLLSQPSNIGDHELDSFSVVPELGVTLRYDLTPCLQASVGYNFLYWSKVARAPEQIDTDVNLTQQPPGPQTGELRPVFPEITNDFWAQGLNVGLEYTF